MAVVDNRRRDKWYHHLQKSVEGRRNDQLRELNMGKNWPGNSKHHPAVAMRFGSKPFVNPLAELMTLRQLGSVEQYQENFDSLFTRLELPVGYGINCFISGLKDEIQKGVRLFNPQTLHEAYCLAKLQEATLASIARKNATLSVIDAGKQVHSQKKNEEGPRSEVHSKVATQPEAAVNGKKNRSRFFISSAEIFARWDTGLCTWCDELYFPGHKCTKIDPDTVFEIVEEEEDLLQLDVVVENHPAKDAPQVFDESPRPNAYTKSIEGNVNGQAVAQESVETVPCEHLDGLNPSNGSLAKSTSIAHGKGTSNAQGKQVNDVEHPFVFPLGFPEPHDGWKELNCVGQGTPKPTSLAFMHAWLGEIFAASKLSVVRLVFDPGETIFTCQGKAFPDEVAFIPYTTTADLKSYSKVGFSGDDEWLWDGKNPSSIWGGKPFKALSHIGQRKFTCCFFCPVHCIEKLPLDLDGIRTSVHWKRKDNVLRTSPSRVSNGLVELEEGLLKNLEFLYNEAISKLVTLGDDENVSLKVMVRNGHCGGSIWRWDCLKQILLGEEPIPCSLKIKYHVPEEEIALGPACWLWDYLRRRGAFGFLLPFSGGADSASVVAVVGCLCQLVTKEIEQGDEQVNPDAIRIGQFADGQFPTDSKSLVFFVSWDDHSFLLRVDWDAYYIIDTRGRWFFESLTLAGDDGKESFLAAFLMREMQADMMTRVMANGFCVLVFDPGSCFVIPGSPTEAWEVDSLMVFNEEKLRAEIALAGSNDFAVTVVGSEFMYEDLWVERALVLQALRPLLEKSPSENTSSSGLRIFILTGDSTSNYTKAVAYGAAVQAAVWSGRGNEKVQVDIDAFWNSREQSYTMFLLQLMASRAVADEVLYWLCGTAKESEGYIWQCAPPFKSLELKQSCEQMMKETVKSLHMGGYRAFTILSSQDVQSLLKWQPAVASIDLNEFYALNGPEVTMPRDGLQPWGIFDPGGMISLFTCLLLYTIHNLDAESAVFDPGKHGKRKVVGSVVLCESSGCASQRRGHLEVSSHLTATIFIVTSKLEDKLL